MDPNQQPPQVPAQATQAPTQDSMTFDASPVQQDTPVHAVQSQDAQDSGMMFDAAPVKQDTPVTPKGFLSTVGSDLWNTGKSLIELPGKAVAYAIAGTPDTDTQAGLQAATEAHKTAVYRQFSTNMHAGNYSKAFSGLVNLFDPHYDDPNDPLSQAMASQWDSSAQAKNAMLDAAKKGDALGVIQHAAGVLPIASQVDAAMTNYQKNPTRENLAHVVSSAIPAFVPALAKGGKAAIKRAIVVLGSGQFGIMAQQKRFTPSRSLRR
jgi:hypothetical protein